MPMKSRSHLQTMAYAYQEICQGEEPWVALGNFMNAWFANAKDRRDELVADPPVVLLDASLDLRRWAAFIAASVEWFCARYGVSCPAWVHDPGYRLAEPWWYSVNADRPAVHAWLIAATPEPFTRRNIYCGDRIYNNKYELDDLVAKLREIRERKQAAVSGREKTPG